MSSTAQITANIANARSSTGPRSTEGKATSSKNAVTCGLYTAGDFVRPGEERYYDDLNAGLLHDLAPASILENNLVDEIRRAMWRLRRCGEVESNLVIRLNTGNGCILDAMETDAMARTQNSVDRARAQAHRLLHKCTAELRRLQTDRQYAGEFFHDGADTSDIGLADWRAITKAHAERTRAELRQRKLDGLDNVVSILETAHREVTTPVTQPTQSAAPHAPHAPQIARNAPCPCNSGKKFKRCCA